MGKTDDSTSLKSTPLIEAERQVESFRQVREAHRMELVEDYVYGPRFARSWYVNLRYAF